MKYKIQILGEHPEQIPEAARWFSEKWEIPEAAYAESMGAHAADGEHIPRWYVALDADGKIIAGAGMIDNDFHDHTDLSPNLCALYVEEAQRRQGIAKALLDFARADAKKLGFERLYLVTEHTEFYEKCGWQFLTMAREPDGNALRLYETVCE